MHSADIELSRDELRSLTGYRRPAEQLIELHKRGFHRAYRNAAGRLILERVHYEAVCKGAANHASVGPRWSKAA